METHVTEQPVSGDLRQHILAALLSHCLFSETEQVWPVHFVQECEDIARLMRWGARVQVEPVWREAEAARQRRDHATHDKLYHLRATPFRSRCPRLPQPLPNRVVGALRADRRANTFNRLAARFQPANELTCISLLNRQAR